MGAEFNERQVEHRVDQYTSGDCKRDLRHWY